MAIGYPMRVEDTGDNSITKAVHVLNSLREFAGGASARELSILINLPRSTTQRILSTLCSSGMVMQDQASQKYKVGPRALLIGLAYNSGLTLVAEARPHMLALRDITGETVGLSVAIDDKRVFLDEVQSTAELRFAPELGKLYPLWSGANGCVLMSALSHRDVDALLTDRDLDGSVDHPLSKDGTRERLAEFGRTGFATAFNEAITNVNSIAMPVWDGNGATVAAVSISGPAQRFTMDRMTAAVESLRAACRTLSRRLGGRSPKESALASS